MIRGQSIREGHRAVYITDGETRLSMVLERPEGAGKRPLAILLHGFSSCKEKVHTVQAAQAMRDAGFATIRMDLYGHGESGGEFREHTLQKWISNTQAAVRYAEGLNFVTDIYLSGHSQGGLVAALVAGMMPEKISGLILRAPAFMIPQGARDGCLLGEAFDPVHIPDSIPVIKGLTLDGEYIRTAQAADAEAAMDRYPGPVLILHGDEDDVVPAEEAEKAAKRYADCELHIIRGETHHFDRCPETMEDLIRAWCSRRAGC